MDGCRRLSSFIVLVVTLFGYIQADESDTSFNNWLGSVLDRSQTGGSLDTGVQTGGEYERAPSGVGDSQYRVDYSDNRHVQQELQQEQLSQQLPLQQYPIGQFPQQQWPQQQFPQEQLPQQQIAEGRWPPQQLEEQQWPQEQVPQQQFPQQQFPQEQFAYPQYPSELSESLQQQVKAAQDQQHPSLLPQEKAGYNWGDQTGDIQQISAERQSHQQLSPQAAIYRQEPLYNQNLPIQQLPSDDANQLVQNPGSDAWNSDENLLPDDSGLEESSSYAQQQGHPGQQVAQQQSYPNQPQPVGYSDQILLPGQRQGYPEEQPQKVNLAPEQDLYSEDDIRDKFSAQTGLGDQQLPQQQGTPDLRLLQQQQLFPQSPSHSEQALVAPRPMKESAEEPGTTVALDTATAGAAREMTDQELLSSLVKGPEPQQFPLTQPDTQQNIMPDNSELLIHGIPQVPQQAQSSYQLPPYTQDSQMDSGNVLPSAGPSQPAPPIPQYPGQDAEQQSYMPDQPLQQLPDSRPLEAGFQGYTGLQDNQFDEQRPTDSSRTNSLSQFIYPPQKAPQDGLQETNKTENTEQSNLPTSAYGQYQPVSGLYVPDIPQPVAQGENATDEHRPEIMVNTSHVAEHDVAASTVLSSPVELSTHQESNARYPDIPALGPDGLKPLGTSNVYGTDPPSSATTEGDDRLIGGKEGSEGRLDADMKQWLNEFNDDERDRQSDLEDSYDDDRTTGDEYTDDEYNDGYDRYADEDGDDEGEGEEYDDDGYIDEDDEKNPNTGAETAMTDFRHEPIRLHQYNDNNMSLIVFYTWLGVVSFMVIIAFVIAKHRQKIYASVHTWYHGSETDHAGTVLLLEGSLP